MSRSPFKGYRLLGFDLAHRKTCNGLISHLCLCRFALQRSCSSHQAIYRISWLIKVCWMRIYQVVFLVLQLWDGMTSQGGCM